jgi:transcriptional regulator with XRE-family HTH domain
MHDGFGGLLKRWRSARRLSQEALSFEAEISTRHLSFLETGKARPSREMVLLLSSALELELRERNLMLGAAGFARLAPTLNDLAGNGDAEAIQLLQKLGKSYILSQFQLSNRPVWPVESISLDARLHRNWEQDQSDSSFGELVMKLSDGRKRIGCNILFKLTDSLNA